MFEGKLATAFEFERDAADVREALETAQAGLDRLDWDCTSQTAGRLVKGFIEHVAAAWKLLGKLTAPDL